MSSVEPVLASIAVLLLLAVGTGKLTRRLGIPVLLVFIGIGMLAGSEGIGGIEFTDFELAQSVGITSLAFILFAGGLDTDANRVRPVVAPALSLATVGVAVTGLIVGGAAHLVLDVPWKTGMLVGAIVSSTDAAAVFAVLRSQAVGLRGEIQPTLEPESGSKYLADQTFLRGSQRSDRSGMVEFGTIFSGWYPGRTVHIHIMVHAAALQLTSQLYFPDEISDQILIREPYSQRPEPDTTNDTDEIFPTGGSPALVDTTPINDGYRAAITFIVPTEKAPDPR